MLHKFRASSLGDIMTDPISINPALLSPELLAISKKKIKTDEDKAFLAPYFDRSLSAGAKTVCEKLAKQLVYGYEETVTSKYMEKGIQVEDRAIELVNSVFFTNYVKNTERRSNDWITGECDIYVPQKKIVDIKAAWSLQTFPATAASATDKGYEWQGRAYMWLWDVDLFETNHCMVSTPEDLIGYEDEALHQVDHINPELRVTRVIYTRDFSLEEKIKIKVDAARDYVAAMVQQIALEHNH